jgi:hypothetical protein
MLRFFFFIYFGFFHIITLTVDYSIEGIKLKINNLIIYYYYLLLFIIIYYYLLFIIINIIIIYLFI